MNLIPFEASSSSVPAAISKYFASETSDLVGNNAGSGFPVISIKGKVFHIIRGDEKILVTKPGEDDPASSLEVVILKANPNRSKVFYLTGYVEGSDSKPDCHSPDGIAPAADAQNPQAKKCAVCPHNVWGSRISEAGKKGKACGDSRRIAVATVDAPADPMLLRVPAASMKAMEDFGKQLAARGVPYQAVVTKVGFDYSVAHPALTFKPVGLIPDAAKLGEIKKASELELVQQIIGTAPMPAGAAVEEEVPVAAETPKAAEPMMEAPKKAEAKPAAKPPAQKPAPAKVVAADVEAEIKGMLDDLNFDD